MPEKQTRLERNVTAALRQVQKLKNVPTAGLSKADVDRVRDALTTEVNRACDLLEARCEEQPEFRLGGGGS